MSCENQCKHVKNHKKSINVDEVGAGIVSATNVDAINLDAQKVVAQDLKYSN